MSNWNRYNENYQQNYNATNFNENSFDQNVYVNQNINRSESNFYNNPLNSSLDYQFENINRELNQIALNNDASGNRNQNPHGIDSTNLATINDIASKSTLVPTAKEFKPSSSNSNNGLNNQLGVVNGAIRKHLTNSNNHNNDGKKTKKYHQPNNYYNHRYSKERNYYHKKNYSDPKNYSKTDTNWRKSNEESNRRCDIANQRERLEEMLVKKILECLVCCEKIRNNDHIWNCQQCHHIFHLNCIKKWAKTSNKDESGWRCPACQNNLSEIPEYYFCYCRKIKNPDVQYGVVPHSCGEMCRKKLPSCQHFCTILCHPGKCPDCNLIVEKSCGCGATKQLIKCNSNVTITCQNKCRKLLNCQLHSCEEKCHEGDCSDCTIVIKQKCYCSKEEKSIGCSIDNDANGGKHLKFSCGNLCEKTLNCGNHNCFEVCHDGDCPTCPFGVAEVTTCPCGKMKLNDVRTSCLDPIKCCDQICNKPLKCGSLDSPHLCQNKCHNGKCPPCPLTTSLRCRCGHMDREIDCVKLKGNGEVKCEKKCNKKRQCGKHKCNQLCCVETEHVCQLICNRQLSCGLHKCEELCHNGKCPPCWRISFDELYCECGSNVLYPPIKCGQRPPPCNNPCPRTRTCGHDANHTCHYGPCPPCFVFVKRWCHGKHEERSTIPCHLENFSCGLPCNKQLMCQRHKCKKVCHTDECPMPCQQPCQEKRSNCEHPCSQPCHEPPCPETSCKQFVKVTCQCGLRSGTRVCMELINEYQSLQLANKMAEIQRGQTVDISDIIIKSQKKQQSFKTLECTEECRVIERNRRLAIGLQIRNPDLSQKLTPKYSDFMRNWAKKDPKFCQTVHDKLTELVKLAKDSKQKSRSHSFDSMNRDKRHFVHEYCQHFGCESAAYDQEPNRNVVATAFKDKSWLPSVSLLELMQRESGQRKVPGPTVLMNKANNLKKGDLITSSTRLPTTLNNQPSTPPTQDFIDYFNDPPV